MMYGDFVWFTGVVEDRNDPEMMNRVRVRCFGYHSESKSDIATADLPWASVMMPTTASGNSGIFESPHGLIEGSWVVGFFRDGHDGQDPVIMGSVASRQMDSAGTGGFYDPSRTYPKTNYIGDSATDVNEHARGVITSVVTKKNSSISVDVPTASSGTWSEPETQYAPVYPKNHVHESESGHLREIDDTEGAERLHEYHKSGTFREVHPDGTVVHRIVGDEYEIVAGGKNVSITGNVNLTIEKNCDTYVKGNLTEKVDGNVLRTIGGTLTENVTGAVTQNYAGSRTMSIGGSDSITIGGSRTTSVGGADTLTVDGKHTITAPNVSFTFSKGQIVVSSGSIIDTGVVLHSHDHSSGF